MEIIVYISYSKVIHSKFQLFTPQKNEFIKKIPQFFWLTLHKAQDIVQIFLLWCFSVDKLVDNHEKRKPIIILTSFVHFLVIHSFVRFFQNFTFMLLLNPFFSVPYTLTKQELYLSVYRPVIVLCPCSDLIPKTRRKPQHHLLLCLFLVLDCFFFFLYFFLHRLEFIKFLLEKSFSYIYFHNSTL